LAIFEWLNAGIAPARQYDIASQSKAGTWLAEPNFPPKKKVNFNRESQLQAIRGFDTMRCDR
jgi:hypothetical protein